MNPRVDLYFNKAEKWGEELRSLRVIILACGLAEELKWGKPCYTYQQSNIVILQSFKSACALLFAKGALLKDPHQILEKPGENTQAARRILFTSVQGIAKLQAALRAYIQEAMQVQEAGLEVTYKEVAEFELPAELKEKLEEVPALKIAFHALTPGRQRGYILHFAGAKQSKTRAARIEKCVPQILGGKGLND